MVLFPKGFAARHPSFRHSVAVLSPFLLFGSVSMLVVLFRLLARVPLPVMQRLGIAFGWLVWWTSPRYRQRFVANAATLRVGFRTVSTADGVQRVSDAQVEELVEQIVASRRQRPDGPAAPLT